MCAGAGNNNHRSGALIIGVTLAENRLQGHAGLMAEIQLAKDLCNRIPVVILGTRSGLMVPVVM